jgi:hypothetical protein
MRRWIGSILSRLDTGTVRFLQGCVKHEPWAAHVHDGRIYLSKGTLVFMLGDCESVVNKCFTPEMREGVIND